MNTKLIIILCLFYSITLHTPLMVNALELKGSLCTHKIVRDKGGKILHMKETLENNSCTWEKLKNGGELCIKHIPGRSVIVKK